MRRVHYGLPGAPQLHVPPEYRALAAALTPPDALREQWRARLAQTVTPMTRGRGSRAENLALAAAADLTEWLLCAQPGEPLPDTLVLQEGNGGHIRLTGARTELYELPRGVEAAAAQLRAEQTAFFERHRATILPAIDRVIEVSPQYRALKALALPAPRRAAETPLTARQVEQRIAARRSAIDGQFGIDSSEYVAPGSLHDQLLRAVPGRVELETASRPRRDTAPQDKVHAWLLQQAQTWWPADQRDGDIARISVALHDTVEYLTATDTTGRNEDIDDRVLGWTLEFCKDAAARLPLLHREPATDLAHRFAVEFYRNDDRDVAAALERAVAATARTWLADLGEFREASEEVALLLRQLPDPILATMDEISTVAMSGPTRARQGTTRELAEDAAATAGEVIHRADRGDVTRLIMAATTLGQYPPVESRLRGYDLVIDLEPYILTDIAEPHIPGFQVTARTGNRWAFHRADNDPYNRTGNGPVLHPSGVAELADVYHAIGLRALADAVTEHQARHGEFSAFGLERLVPRHSTYPAPRHPPPPDPDQPEYPPVEWFARHVRDGRLHVQCTGASLFYAASVSRALPGCNATTVAGLVLGRGDRITGSGHAQTALPHQGTFYLLDATAPAPPELGLTDSDLRRNPRPQASRRTAATSSSGTTSRVVNRAAAEAARAAAAAASVPTQLEEILHHYYGEPSLADTRRRISVLKDTDPVRRAIAAGRNPGSTDVATVVAELDRYVNHPPDVRARAARVTGVTDAPELVALLVDCLRPLIPAGSAAPVDAVTQPASPTPRPTATNRGTHSRVQPGPTTRRR